MNERIKELAEQALKSEMRHDGVYRPDGFANAVSKVFADKFAELIARECILLAMHQHTSKIPEHYSELNEYDKGCDDTAIAIASNIRFCFGVKD